MVGDKILFVAHYMYHIILCLQVQLRLLNYYKIIAVVKTNLDYFKIKIRKIFLADIITPCIFHFTTISQTENLMNCDEEVSSLSYKLFNSSTHTELVRTILIINSFRSVNCQWIKSRSIQQMYFYVCITVHFIAIYSLYQHFAIKSVFYK